MMALRELLCYCHIVGPRHLRPLVRWGDHYGYVPIGPCWKACTRFRVRDSQGPFVRLGSRDWGVELPLTLLALEVPCAMPMCPARHYEMPECGEIN